MGHGAGNAETMAAFVAASNSLPRLEEAVASVVKICFGGTLGTRPMACFLFKKMLASREAAAAEATTDVDKAAALDIPLEVRCKVYYYLVDVGGPGEQRTIRLGWQAGGNKFNSVQATLSGEPHVYIYTIEFVDADVREFIDGLPMPPRALTSLKEVDEYDALAKLKIKELRRKALELGASEDQIDDAAELTDYKDALIGIIRSFAKL